MLTKWNIYRDKFSRWRRKIICNFEKSTNSFNSSVYKSEKLFIEIKDLFNVKWKESTKSTQYNNNCGCHLATKINKERKGFVFNVSFCKKQPMKWRDQHYTKGRTKTIINAKSQKKLAKSFVCGKTIAAIMRKSRSQSVRKFLNK